MLTIIGQMFTNKKAGRPMWHALVPILNIYTRANIGGCQKNFIGILVGLLGSVLFGTAGAVLSGVNETLGLVAALTSFPFAIVALIFVFKMEASIASSFGKGKGFSVGLVLLPFIFNPILGFSKNIEYTGEVPEIVEKPKKAPKEPKPKKEKAPKPTKEPKSKEPKSKKQKNKAAPAPEPSVEEEPPRPEFKPQYDMGDTEEVKETPAAPRMTMDQMMLNSLKAKKATPPPPVEEPKPAPAEEKKEPETPSNRFSIPVEYVPEPVKVEVPKADYLVPAFARPDYQPAPPTPPVEPEPPLVEPIVPPAEEPIAPAYEHVPESAPTFAPPIEEKVDPFKFFGLPDTPPVIPQSPYQNPAIVQPRQAQAVEVPVAPPAYEPPVQQAPVWTEPQNKTQPELVEESVYQQPEVIPQEPAYKQPVYEEPPAPVYEQPEQVSPPVFEQPAQNEQPLFAAPVNNVPDTGLTLDIPGFGTLSDSGATTPASDSVSSAPVVESAFVTQQPEYVAEPVATEVSAPGPQSEIQEQLPTVEQTEQPIIEERPKMPPRFIDPKPVEEPKPVDDDEELPPPPVVPLPPKRGLFSKKPKTIDRFHNEDGGLK